MSWTKIIPPSSNATIQDPTGNNFIITGPDNLPYSTPFNAPSNPNLNLVQDTSVAWTIEVWLKYTPDGTTKGAEGIALSFGGQKNVSFAIYKLAIAGPSNSKILDFRMRSGPELLVGNPAIPVNKWFHVAVVYTGISGSGNNLFLYQDGSLVNQTTTTLPQDASQNSNNLLIGNIVGGFAADTWNGCIGNLHITKSSKYNAAFTPARILTTNSNTILSILPLTPSESWTFIKRQFIASGKLNIDYSCTNNDVDPTQEKAVWDAQSSGVLNPLQTLDTTAVLKEITYSADDWVSVGVRSLDGILGTGILNVSFRYAPTIGTATVTGPATAEVTFTTPEIIEGITGYSVIGSSGTSADYNPLSGNSIYTFSITGLTSNTPCTFQVRANYTLGGVLSDYSNSITIFLQPTIGTATATGVSTAELTFTDPGIVPQSYSIFDVDSNGDLTLLNSTAPSAGIITISGLTANTTYNLKIQANYATGFALSTTSLGIKTFSLPIIGTAIATGISTAEVTFTTPNDINGIQSYTAVIIPSDGTSTSLSTLSSDSTGTFSITGLTANKIYTFKVSANYATGTALSDESNQIKTLKDNVAVITFLSVTLGVNFLFSLLKV